MTVLAFAIFAVAVIVPTVLFVRSLLREDQLRRELDKATAAAAFERKQVRLHLSGADPSVEGILMEPPGEFYRLVQGVIHSEEDQAHAVDGEVWVQSGKVLLMQVITT